MLGKKHIVEADLKNYKHLIIGDKKIGKTSLVADIAVEKYGGIDRLLMLSIGNEKAFEGINNAIYEEPQNWTELINMIDSLIEHDGMDFDVVSVDTIDKVIGFAEEEVINQHIKQYREIPKSFNACFGGYGEPRKKVRALIDELDSKLDELKGKTAVFLIGHNKEKLINTKTAIEGYYIITSNLPTDYFNMFAYHCPIICNIVQEIDTEVIGEGDTSRALRGNKNRLMYFRDSGVVEAGGRLKGMPEKAPYGAKSYIETFKEGVENSKGSYVESKVSQPKPTAKKVENELDEYKEKLMAIVMELAQKGKQQEVMDILKANNIDNPKKLNNVTDGKKAILELQKL